MKKSVLLLLALLLAALPLAGCARIDTAGLLDAAPALLARAAFFNEIYFGEGIPINPSGASVGGYVVADQRYLDEHGFHTIDELKAKTEEVFSPGYCAAIYPAAFAGFAAEGGYIYARYSSSQAAALRDENETILVSVNNTGLLTKVGKTTYDYDSVRLIGTGRDYATVGVMATTDYYPTADEPLGRTEETELEIRFVRVDGAWRIDSPTY